MPPFPTSFLEVCLHLVGSRWHCMSTRLASWLRPSGAGPPSQDQKSLPLAKPWEGALATWEGRSPFALVAVQRPAMWPPSSVQTQRGEAASGLGQGLAPGGPHVAVRGRLSWRPTWSQMGRGWRCTELCGHASRKPLLGGLSPHCPLQQQVNGTWGMGPGDVPGGMFRVYLTAHRSLKAGIHGLWTHTA